ncbi:lipopolysaccharide kinase InaA family protein [Stutzerimonas nitrititolerans]|uniref:InaA protein n=1 Tax=Stutzerimonas nitrititolerans TaxID=2482751 RepID=A0AA42BEM8_9GAMM|nr:lipopolysaccharide kinase InaA family protein [Stutzerimonas nitrititolerans]MCO7543328.1 InaA protein [Stutzerimonas nitrititolerans]
MAGQIVLSSPGQVSSAFQRWWNTRGEWVEPPNVRRDGESGVQLLQTRDRSRPALYCKRQVGHLYRSLRHPFGRPTVLREQVALSAFGRLGVRVPDLVYCGASREGGRWQALLVTRALTGFVSLDAWYRDGAQRRYGDAVHRQMLEQLGLTLSRVHLGRWQHGCCYPKHIFIRPSDDGASVEVALLDLEKSRRRLRRSAASRHDLRQLYRHRDEIPLTDMQLFRKAYDAAFAIGRGRG